MMESRTVQTKKHNLKKQDMNYMLFVLISG